MSSDKKRLPGWAVFLAWFVIAGVVFVMLWVAAYLSFGFQSEPTETKPTETKERICPFAGPCFDIPIESP
jgi:hypothetical protein